MSSIGAFFDCATFAVAGASTDRSKFGNRVLRHYVAHGRDVVAINPRENEVEGVPCYASLSEVPEIPEAVSIVTPPHVTDAVVNEALALGIGHLWMQPGAESMDAIEAARAAGANVIAGGACVLVELR